MAGWKFAVLVAEKGCFGGQYGRAGVKRKLLFVKTFGCLRTEKKGLCKRKALDLCKMVQVHLERFSTNENVFSLRKGGFFSSCKAM